MTDLTIDLPKTDIRIVRKLLPLGKELINEAAKPPYQAHLAITTLGNMLFDLLHKAGSNPLFRLADPRTPDLAFGGIEIDVPEIFELPGEYPLETEK